MNIEIIKKFLYENLNAISLSLYRNRFFIFFWTFFRWGDATCHPSSLFCFWIL